MDLADTLLETHRVDSGQLERGLNFNGSYRRPLFKTHALALGWEPQHQAAVARQLVAQRVLLPVML